MGKKAPKAEEQLDELRELVNATDGEDGSPRKTDRRGILKLAGGALLGAAGAVAVRAIPAAAASGDYMLTGCYNFATTVTQVATSNTVNGFEAQGAVGVQGNGNAAVVANEVGVLGTSKSGSGTGVRGSVSGGVGVEGIATTGTAGKFHTAASSTTGYDVQLGQLNADAGILGSGRLGMIGRGDVGGTAPNWNPAFYVHSSLGILNFQHELVRGNDSSIWASRFDDSSVSARARWKRINTVRVDTSDGAGGNFKPFRVIDTRITGGIRAPSSLNVVTVGGTGTGNSSIPADAVAVMGNLTAVGYTGAGFLTIMPAGIALGTGVGQYNAAADPSSLNFILGQAAIANSFVCGLHNGQLQVYVGLASTYFIVDVTAYLQ